MVWVIFFIFVCLTAIFVIPLKSWKSVWLAGLITVFVIYLIDSTLITLGAFSYVGGIKALSDIPLFYLISGIPGGALLIYRCPGSPKRQLPYILLAAFLFLVLELFMYKIGYFNYHHWNPIKSYFLDVFGFIVVVSLNRMIHFNSDIE